MAYRQEREREGASGRQVARELGVSEATLARWGPGREEPAGSFRAIEVVLEPARSVGAMVVHGPRGLRIEGLSVEQLAELVARLS
jgi:hypothetical protein